MTTLPYDVMRCTGRMDDAHWCKQRNTCQRHLAHSVWDKHEWMHDYLRIPVAMAVTNCEIKIEVTHE